MGRLYQIFKEVITGMSEKEKKDIAEMVKTARELAKKDPQGFLIAKSNIDILKARADMEREKETEKEVV